MCFRRLLDLYYASQKPISLELEMVARKIRIPLGTLTLILGEFFERKPDGFHNNKADGIIAEYESKVTKARINGAKGGRPKPKKTSVKTNPLTQGNQDGSQAKPDANQIERQPITINHKPKPLDLPLYPPLPDGEPDWFAHLPKALDTFEFRDAWMKWVNYRKTIKKPLNPLSATAAWKRALEVGATATIDSFERAIANGWQGAFPAAQVSQQNESRDQKRAREFSEQITVPDL